MLQHSRVLSFLFSACRLIILTFHCPPSSQFLKLIFHTCIFPLGNFCPPFTLLTSFLHLPFFVSLSELLIGRPIRTAVFSLPRRFINHLCKLTRGSVIEVKIDDEAINKMQHSKLKQYFYLSNSAEHHYLISSIHLLDFFEYSLWHPK